MRSKFDEQLRLLNQEMMYMGTMIEDSIQKAIEALIDQNAQLAEKIMNSDSDVDHEQKKIENICFNLLMQQQPVARDLRVISAAMKMVTDMERIGDHAADISEITIMLSKEPYVLNLDDIKKMASETVIMLIRSIEAYVEKDMNKAQEVIRHDDIVDDLFDKNKADIIELIRHDPEKGEQAADMLMVTKYFERIGDHATNIAEWVIFYFFFIIQCKDNPLICGCLFCEYDKLRWAFIRHGFSSFLFSITSSNFKALSGTATCIFMTCFSVWMESGAVLAFIPVGTNINSIPMIDNCKKKFFIVNDIISDCL